MIGLFKLLFVFSFISAAASLVLAISFLFAAVRNTKPEVDLRRDLKGNVFNSITSEKWLNEDGIRYRQYHFRAIALFIASAVIGILVGSLIEWIAPGALMTRH